MFERMRTAWNSLTDASGKDLLLRGPLPLWMQDRFEREAERQGVPVGDVIFRALDRAARELPDGLDEVDPDVKPDRLDRAGRVRY